MVIMNFYVLALFLINFINISITENVKKSVDDIQEDNGETGDDGKDESWAIPADTESVNYTCTRRQNSQMHEIRRASYKQFPFVVAIMTLQNQYLCSGSIVSHALILTSANCANKAASYVLVNTISDKDATAAALRIIKYEQFPSYTGQDSVKDVAIIYTEKHNKTIASKINLSNITNTKMITDMEALGFGLNADVGKPKELQYIGVELRDSDGDHAKAFIDCIETKIPTCFKDYGGPVIVDNQLFGIVISGSSTCSNEISANYAIHKFIANILPTYTFKGWLDDKIRKNEEKEPIVLETYPSQPVSVKTAHVMTSGRLNLMTPTYSLVCFGAIVTAQY